MKRKQQCMAFLLAGLVTIGSLTGCGRESGEENTNKEASIPQEVSQSAQTEERIEEIKFPLAEEKSFTVFSTINGEVDMKDTLAFQKMEELTNVKWDMQSAMPADAAEKRGLLISSKQYPDVFLKGGFTQDEIEKYGKQEIFLPLNDLIEDYAPNIKKMMEERPEAKAVMTSDDGNIYSLPEVKVKTPAIPAYYFNNKWLENLGLEEPTNPEELYTVLKAFKEQDANGNGDPGDEIPLLTSAAPTDFKLLLPYFGVPFNVATKCAVVDGELQYMPVTDTFKELLAFSRRLYEEGLMDKNCFIQTLDQQRAIGMSEDVVGSFFDYGPFLTVGKERDDDYRILTPFEKGSFPTALGIDNGALVITDACANPEVVIAWADQFYSEEGGILALMGVEGESYEMNEDGTWDWIIGDYENVADLRAHVSMQGSGLIPYQMPRLWIEGMTDPDEKYLHEERNRVIGEAGADIPVLKVAKEDTQTLASIKADIDVYIDQYAAKVITGEEDLEGTWETYLGTLEQMGVSEMKRIYADAYEKGKQVQ